MLTIAADPKRLAVKIGFTSVLHTWGSARPHDCAGWWDIARRHTLDALPCQVLFAGEGPSRLFRRLTLEMLLAAHDAGRLQFFGDHAHLAEDYEDPRRVKGKGG